MYGDGVERCEGCVTRVGVCIVSVVRKWWYVLKKICKVVERKMV